jgi:hypothetical protein
METLDNLTEQITSLNERWKKSRIDEGLCVQYISNGKMFNIKIFEKKLPCEVQVFYNNKPYGIPIQADAKDFLNFTLGENKEFFDNIIEQAKLFIQQQQTP